MAMALTRDEWLSRYRKRILYHQPAMSPALLDDYATVDTYDVMSLDFPDEPEFAVDIDPDLAYVGHAPAKETPSPSPQRRSRPELSPRDD